MAVSPLLPTVAVPSTTQAGFNTMSGWFGPGVNGVWQAIGGYPPGFGGVTGTALTNQINAAASNSTLAHNATSRIITLYGIYLQNYFFSKTIYTTNPAPCLGNWNPAYTDGNGNGWGGTTVPYTAGSWNLMMYNIGLACAQHNMDGVFWDTEGGGIGPQPQFTVANCTVTSGSKTVTCTGSPNSFTNATPISSGYSGPDNIRAPYTVSGSGVGNGNGVASVTNATSLQLSNPATANASGTTLTFTGGQSFMTWQWRNYFNNYGGNTAPSPGQAVSNQSEQNGWAQTAGFNMVTALQRGWTAGGGVGALPIYMYQSQTVGFAMFPNAYYDIESTAASATVNEFHGPPTSGFVSTPVHTALVDSTYTSFIAGCAAATTGPIYCGDSTFYSVSAVTNGPYKANADGGWLQSLQNGNTGVQGLSLGSNVYYVPYVWPGDQTGSPAGSLTWTQAQWNQAIPSILSYVQSTGANTYLIFQLNEFNYANDTLSSHGGTGQNFTPLGLQPASSGHIQDFTVSNSTTFPITLTGATTTANNFVMVQLGGAGSAIPNWTVSGAGVVNWTYSTTTSSNGRATIAWGQVTGTPSNSIVVTLTSGNTSLGTQITASEFSGIGGFATAVVASGNSATANPGSYSPGPAGYTFVVANATSTHFTSTPSGMTAVGGINHSGISGWVVESAGAAPQSPNSNLTSGPWASVMAVFFPTGQGIPSMPPPAGYSSGQKIFEDQFSGTSLDTTKWSTMMGAGGFLFNNGGGAGGALPVPYTGGNIVSLGRFNSPGCNYWHPSNVVVNNGLTINSSVNPSFNNGSLIGNYQYQAGSIVSYAAPGTPTSGAGGSTAAFALPNTGWYVQANIKLGPNIANGMNYTFWFLPVSGGTNNEMDFVQPTLSYQVGATVSNAGFFPLGTGYFDNGGSSVQQSFPNVGFDATAAYHIYGVEWIPGVSVKGYIDGTLWWTVTNAQVPGGITSQRYEIILHTEVWDSDAAGYAWTACLAGSAAGVGSDPIKHTAYSTYTGNFQVAEVQAYSHSNSIVIISAGFTLNGTMTTAASGASGVSISAAFALGGSLHAIGPSGGANVGITAAFALGLDMTADAEPGFGLGVDFGIGFDFEAPLSAPAVGCSAAFALNGAMRAQLTNNTEQDAGLVSMTLNSSKVAITLE